MYLVVYVDDIIITGKDRRDIGDMRQHLFRNFATKDLVRLGYFLWIEVVQQKDGIAIFQRKYALEILEEIEMLDCKLVETPMYSNDKLLLDCKVCCTSNCMRTPMVKTNFCGIGVMNCTLLPI